MLAALQLSAADNCRAYHVSLSVLVGQSVNPRPRWVSPVTPVSLPGIPGYSSDRQIVVGGRRARSGACLRTNRHDHTFPQPQHPPPSPLHLPSLPTPLVAAGWFSDQSVKCGLYIMVETEGDTLSDATSQSSRAEPYC